MGQEPKINAGEGATIRAMLGAGESMGAAARAVGVTKMAVSRWCSRERAAGRAVPIAQRRPRAKSPTPAPSAAAPTPLPDDDDEVLSPDAAQRRLSALARHADPRVRIAALGQLLAWREKQPAESAAPDRVPRELAEIWSDERWRAVLLRLLARAGYRPGARSTPASG